MKQLFIAGTSDYAASGSALDVKDMTTLSEGAIAITSLADGSLIESSEAASDDFAVFLGAASGVVPRSIPEVNFKSLKCVLAEPKAAVAEVINITPTVSGVEDGDVYTVIFSKLGVAFNERSNWSIQFVAKETSTVADVVAGLKKDIENKGLPFSFSSNTSVLIATAIDGSTWAVSTADEFQGTAAVATKGSPAVGDKEYIKDLARQCAAGKGFNYLADDGIEIYPGFPETIGADSYYVLTLRWAVPRKSAKTRDEVVSQLLHIAIPASNTNLLQALMAILPVTASGSYSY